MFLNFVQDLACPIRLAEPLFLLTGAVLRACSGFELIVRCSIKISSKSARRSIDSPVFAWERVPIQFRAEFQQNSITIRSKFVKNCSNLDGIALRSISVPISIKSRSSFDQIWVAIGRILNRMWFLSTPWGVLGCPGKGPGPISGRFGCPGAPNCFKLDWDWSNFDPNSIEIWSKCNQNSIKFR